jgi:tetratricopeptide (TPR) repeat protein
VGLFVILNGLVEFSLFDTVFRQRNVYDPTTYDILNALGAIPSTILPGAASSSTLAAVLAFTGAGLVVIGVWKQAMTEQNENAESPSRLRPPVLIALGIASLLAAFFAGRLSARNDGPKPETSSLGAPNLALPQLPAARTNARDPMAEGLDALYTQKDPAKAVARFREVLATDPNHYGATYQLATALEQAHDLPAARATWSKMVPLAEVHRDEATLAHARARMAALVETPAPELQKPAVEDPFAESMRLGLAALYEKNDPIGATKYFRDVLAKNPKHYGATFQLATALEKAGKRDEAKPLWMKTLEMAEEIKDTQTAAIARKHLGKTGAFGGFQ